MNFACPVSCVDLQVDPIHTAKSNVHGVINMLEIARKNNAKFVQASSADVYGVRAKGDVLSEDMLGQLDNLTARACYEEGKRLAETICMDYHRQYKVDVKIARIFNTYGPNMYYRDGRVMSNFITAALLGKPITIYGDGSYTRCHLYVDDLVEGLDRLAKQPFEFTGPINLGADHEMTIKDLAELVIRLTGSKSEIIYDRELTGDPKFRHPNTALAKRVLGWSPTVPVEEGARRTIEHYRQLNMPEKKVLVFATTYYPDHGPAENALMELAKSMPNTEFHILAVKSRRALPGYERIDNSYIHRLGSGNLLGKYLFPWRAAWQARSLAREHDYKFAWAIMASYAGLAAVLFKWLKPGVSFLLTFDSTELSKRGGFKSMLFKPLLKLIFREADSVYLSDEALKEKSVQLGAKAGGKVIDKEGQKFVDEVYSTYSQLLSKHDGKLARPM
jgi:UDP-glucuronate decarboxylase